MASSLPSPPSSPSASAAVMSRSVSEPVEEEAQEDETPLSQHLDALLASYLELLDTYAKLRAQLSGNLSAGFFSLAQANRNSTLGPGRRYGEEGYDERMKALRTVRIDLDKSSAHSSATLEARDNGGEHISKAGGGLSKDGQSQDTLENEPGRTKQEGTKNDYPLPNSSNPMHSVYQLSPCYTYCTTISTTPPKEPLKWYGILVPPSLRQCQTNFQTAVSSTIPDILSTTSAMQNLEAQIWLVRRELGILDSYKRAPEAPTATESSGNETRPASTDGETSLSSLSLGKNQTKSPRQPSGLKPSPTRKASLLPPTPSTRTSEPRSRVLKLD
jgi:hypothetical protein